jgi:Tol biopolymer transport system component
MKSFAYLLKVAFCYLVKFSIVLCVLLAFAVDYSCQKTSIDESPYITMDRLSNSLTTISSNALYYGHRIFKRTAESPMVVSEQIENRDFEQFENNFVLKILNGNNKKTRVAAAQIKIDGNLILGPSDFNKDITSITKDLPGLTSKSVIEVRLLGTPDSFIDIWIEGTLKPGRGYIDEKGGIIISEDKNVVLQILPNTIDNRLLFSITESNVDVPNIPNGNSIGKVYLLEPSGIQFKTPIEIMYNYAYLLSLLPNPEYLGVFHWKPGGFSEELNLKNNDNCHELYFALNHFSNLSLFLKEWNIEYKNIPENVELFFLKGYSSDEAEYPGTLYVFDSKMKIPQKLFNSFDGQCGNFDISKDGTQIVFSALRDNNWDIWTAELSGNMALTPPVPVDRINSTEREDDPRFSYNGNKIVYKKSNDIYLYNFKDQANILNGSDICLKETIEEEWAPVFSTSDEYIAFGRGVEPIRGDGVESEGGNIVLLNVKPPRIETIITQNQYHDWFPAFNYLGDLLFVSKKTGDDNIFKVSFDNLKGNSSYEEINHLNDSNSDADPSIFYGNNDFLAFVSDRNHSKFGIYMYDFNRSRTDHLISNRQNKLLAPVVIAKPFILFENFEPYSSGFFPNSWIPDGNGTNISKNYIDNSTFKSDSKSLKLFGVLGGCWASIAYHQFSIRYQFTVELSIKNGSESLYGCNPFRGKIGLRQGQNWTNPERPLMVFRGDGKVYSGSEKVLSFYNTNQWYNIKIKYERISPSTVNIYYWIDNSYLGYESLNTIANEDLLDHFELCSLEGSTWFDDIKIYK